MDRDEQIAARIRQDPYASELGASLETLAPGYSRVSLTITETMTNFHGMTHGGVIFSLGDIAFAAASNSRGQTAVALNMDISFLRATGPGDRLVAECREIEQGGPIALYEITIARQDSQELIAKIQAMVYRKRDHFVPPTPSPAP